MKKHLLIILAAGLLLLSATACNKDSDDNKDTDDILDTEETTGSYFVVETDTNGEYITSAQPGSDFDPSEESPEFTAANMEIVIISYTGQVRTSTQIKGDNTVAWPSEGTTYTVTGVSENWYRVKYQDKDCYIAKSIAADASVLATFTAIEGGEMMEVINADTLNVRSYPSADSDHSIRGQIYRGNKVKRLASNDTWSLIEVELPDEVETDAEGNPVKVVKKCYVKSSFLQAVSATTEAATNAQ